MKEWINELESMAQTVLATPTLWIMVVMILAGALLFVMVFDKLGDYMNFASSRAFDALIVLITSVSIPTAAAIAAVLYLSPRFGEWPARIAPLVGILLAALISRLIVRGKYLHRLLAIIISLAAAAGIMALTHAAIHAFMAGDRSVDSLRERRVETRDAEQRGRNR